MKIPRLFIVTVACLAMGCEPNTSLFQLVPADRSNIEFDNRIAENDTINPFDVTNMYNGAGVGVGDFNNDGLTDIYFAGNQVSCRLYLNKGDMSFRDVTSVAKVDGNVAKAAELLGVSRPTLYDLMNRHGLK